MPSGLAKAFLGIPTTYVAAVMDPGLEVDLSYEGVYVQIDEKFAKLARDIEASVKPWKCSSLECMVAEGYLDNNPNGIDFTGARSFFSRVILTAAGISSPMFYEQAQGALHGALSYGTVAQAKLLPIGIAPISIRHKPCEHALAHVAAGFLEPLIRVLATHGKLTVIDPLEATDDLPVKLTCVKTALTNLLERRGAAQVLDQCYGIEEWINIFISKYLEARDCFSFTSIVSTAYGSIIRHGKSGGMHDGVPYIVFGEMQDYDIDDEDSWTDPRKEDPEAAQQLRDCLLGSDQSHDWEKLTPEFSEG